MPVEPENPSAATPAKKIALVSMPTLSVIYPSFQLGLLKSTLEKHDIEAQTFSMYVYFGAHIGWQLNETLSEVRRAMLGEWIWAKAAFGDFADDDAYLARFETSLASVCKDAGCTLDDLVDLRDRQVPAFLDFCVDSVDWRRFEMIGLTVVFQQMLASLAMARALKERYPEIPVILGGGTFETDIAEDIMGGCDWVDFIHCGDADVSFPEMIHRRRQGVSLDGVPGLMWRDGEDIRFAGRAPNLANLDLTPIPDFDEYFYAREESGYAAYPHAKEVMLPIETARGCWWGAKAHCTFCGLNRAGMEFRAKSVDNVLAMLEELASRYGILYFDAIDNIVAIEYIDELFGKLAENHADIRIHYEVRPHLTREQLKHMSRGGLFSVQPGIESLNTHVLKLMKKHTTGINNLAFMKWCNYYGLNSLYFILHGFRGETEEDYDEQCRVIRKIPHFLPPRGVTQARADRGSPMYTDPEANAVSKMRPSPCYEFLYPIDRFDLEKVSYYFNHDQGEVLADEKYTELYTLVYNWQQNWRKRPRPTMRYYKSLKTIRIEDARNCRKHTTTYGGEEARLYEFCNDPRSIGAIVKEFHDDRDWVEDSLSRFIERDYMIELDSRYLSLALPANAHL